MRKVFIQSETRIESIDVWRGIAAMLVLFSHYLVWWDRYVLDLPTEHYWKYGYHAVQLFFVISGVVISNTLDRCSSIKHFAFLRATRLYPAYISSLWLVALITYVVFDKSPWLAKLLVNTTMLQEFVGMGNADNVYWSLTVELAFYFHMAWLFGFGWHRKPIVFSAIWLLLSCAWQVLYGGGEGRDYVEILFVFDQSPYFVCGILLADIRRSKITIGHVAVGLLALLTIFVIEGLNGTGVFLGCAVLVAASLFMNMKWLVNPITLWLGAISYSLYLTHRNLGYLLLRELEQAGFNGMSAVGITTLLALAFATILTYSIEIPITRYLRLRFEAYFKGS